jgi:hypothetical protein
VKIPKPTGNFIRPRWFEIVIAVALVLAATYLLMDAFDAQGKKMPWPLSGLAWW